MRLGIKDIVTLIAGRTGEDRDYLSCLVPEVLAAISDSLQAGHSVKLRNLGTFGWYKRKATRRRHPSTGKLLPVTEGYTLKFRPASTLRPRRGIMSDEGMTKYAVVQDDERVKEASEGSPGPGECYICGRKLDSGGACPVHGTEPFEKKEEQ